MRFVRFVELYSAWQYIWISDQDLNPKVTPHPAELSASSSSEAESSSSDSSDSSGESDDEKATGPTGLSQRESCLVDK